MLLESFLIGMNREVSHYPVLKISLALKRGGFYLNKNVNML